MRSYVLIVLFFHITLILSPQTGKKQIPTDQRHELITQQPILTGACQMEEYLPLLKNKRVAVFANQTSLIGKTHLVDSLQKTGINIIKIFSPEHGFRGIAGAGEQVKDYKDLATGIAVISLYGNKLKPSSADLEDVDIMLFDIQDIGVRFYTYISSLQYYLEAAILNNKPVIILDRPNPNGFYLDGPVLDPTYKSFVGMQPIPIVYGMTIGEYAQMLIGEKWLSYSNEKMSDYPVPIPGQRVFDETVNKPMLTVIKCKNYTHKTKYELPVKPSPNLADMGAVYWYPSICFFEGTVVSEGRGTEHPFQIFGHPKLPDSLYNFTPHSNEGAKTPKFQNQLCYGWNILQQTFCCNNQIQLKWLLETYRLFPDKEEFFLLPQKINPRPTDYFFNKLAGNSQLMQQLKEGKSEEEIRNSWQPGLEIFKKIRKKYLLYKDF